MFRSHTCEPSRSPQEPKYCWGFQRTESTRGVSLLLETAPETQAGNIDEHPRDTSKKARDTHACRSRAHVYCYKDGAYLPLTANTMCSDSRPNATDKETRSRCILPRKAHTTERHQDNKTMFYTMQEKTPHYEEHHGGPQRRQALSDGSTYHMNQGKLFRMYILMLSTT